MKRILVPTDYSDHAFDALLYAMTMADKAGASIILHHAFHDRSSTLGKSYEMQVDEQRANLEEVAQKAVKTSGLDVNITPYVSQGDVRDTVPQIVRTNQVDLVVMGTRGAGVHSKTMFGSNTVSLVHKVGTPLLAIPLNYQYRPVKNIVFASDFNFVNNDDALDALKEVALLFDAGVTLLNVQRHEEQTVEEVLEANREAHLLGDEVRHRIETTEGEKVLDSVRDYIELHDETDMVAMLARKHSWFERLFKDTHTEKMVEYTRVPLLIMHDGDARKALS